MAAVRVGGAKQFIAASAWLSGRPDEHLFGEKRRNLLTDGRDIWHYVGGIAAGFAQPPS